MNVSILDLQQRMSRILKALERNEEVVLTYRGQEKATIVPARQRAKEDLKTHQAFGMWADRKDLIDVRQAVRKIRRRKYKYRVCNELNTLRNKFEFSKYNY